MSAPAPWRHVRHDYERGLPLHRICHRYALFEGVGQAKILKLASQEGWSRPAPDPNADFGPLTMLDPKQPLPVVLFSRPAQPPPATPSEPGPTAQAKGLDPKSADAHKKNRPTRSVQKPGPIPDRLPVEVQISDFKSMYNPIALAIGARFKHFRLKARISQAELMVRHTGPLKSQREIERFERGEWLGFDRMAPVAQAYAAVLGVTPEDLCDIGGTHLNVDVQDLLFHTEHTN